MKTRPLCYNTGKVKIGSAYEPPVRTQFTQDEERLQSALLSYPDLSSHIALKAYLGLILFVCLLVGVMLYANP